MTLSTLQLEELLYKVFPFKYFGWLSWEKNWLMNLILRLAFLIGQQQEIGCRKQKYRIQKNIKLKNAFFWLPN